MRQKELRIALICYGGVSLAVYMHGVIKELWKLTRASQAVAAGEPQARGASSRPIAACSRRSRREQRGWRLRVLNDVVAGASAGGLNGVFLAQAIHSGQSLEPLTQALARAGRRRRAARSRRAALVALRQVLGAAARQLDAAAAGQRRLGCSVAPETRAEVRGKLSRLDPLALVRAAVSRRARLRPPDRRGAHGDGREQGSGPPLLPPGHPLDLFVTATDFKGHMESLRLHSPPLVQEKANIACRSAFARLRRRLPGGELAATSLELVFAARATASFPGAFPALQLAEIDGLAAGTRRSPWPTRAPLRRADHARPRPPRCGRGCLADRWLGAGQRTLCRSDGRAARPSGAARGRSALRLRRSAARPHRRARPATTRQPPGWFSVIFGSLSTIPREQPIRDNLDAGIAEQSRERAHLTAIVSGRCGPRSMRQWRSCSAARCSSTGRP